MARRSSRPWGGKRRRGMTLPFAGRRRRRLPTGKLAGAAIAAAAAVPVAQRAAGAVGQGRRLAHQAADIVDTASTFKDAIASHSSTIGKVGGVISAAKQVGGDAGQNGNKPKLSHLIEEHVDIAVPRSTAYNQWTQFEMFPKLVKGVDSVEQDRRDDRVKWTVKIGPSRRRWTGRIVEQVPDERIAWKSEGGAQHQGVVTFHSLDVDLTRVLVQMEYQPKGAVETVGNTLRVQRRRVRRDLRLFKHFLELRGEETGEWRGRIGDGEQLEPRYAGQSGDGGDGNGKAQGPAKKAPGAAKRAQGAAKKAQGTAKKAQGTAKKRQSSSSSPRPRRASANGQTSASRPRKAAARKGA